MKQKLLAGFFLFYAFAFAAQAKEALIPLRTETPPVIDGKLDDAVWQASPRVTGFKTYVPDYGLEMVGETMVHFAYDRENLYFAFRCFDSEPNKIKSSITRRDNIRPDDWICINLDSFNDQQALYGFYVNPFGIQEDSRFANNREDFGVDLIWYSAGRIDDQGYTIEARIPFKSIRFANKEPVEMGVIFERRVSRRNEQGTFPPLKPERGMFFLTQMHPMVLHDIKHYKLFESLPEVTHFRKNDFDFGAGELAPVAQNSEFGLTAKYGITSDLILDGTYNPDFSQVEADAAQVDVNLRSALFFPEKRPFFLEGSENFNFAGASDFLPAIVHTRTIVDPIAGVKLSGKLGKKNFLAGIDGLDELPEPIEDRKYAHATILRYKRALSGDNYLGVFYTGRELKDAFNRVAGPDGQFRLNESSVLGYHFFLSNDKADPEAAAKAGHALGLDYIYNTRNLDISAAAQDLATDFNTTTGFVTRTGIAKILAGLTPKLYPRSGLIRRIDPTLYSAQAKDKPSGLYETDNSLSLRFVLRRNASFTLRGNYSTEVFGNESFNTAGWNLSANSQLTKQFSFQLSYRYGNAVYYPESLQAKGGNAAANVTYQPSDKLNANFVLTYSDLFREDNDEKIFDGTILRGRLTYQLNRYLFFRGIVERNTFRQTLAANFLASFTYIPGTVIHFGYDSFNEQEIEPADPERYVQTKRVFFAKASYLWRL